MRGSRELRERTYIVGGHEIREPQNGSWYQTSEAVKILYDLKIKGSRIGNQLVQMWRQHTPPWIGISYAKLMKKVCMVEQAVQKSSTPWTPDEAIRDLIRDRSSVDSLPQVGRPPTMNSTDFLEELKKKCRFEHAATQEDAARILSNAKRELYEKRGLKAPSNDVCDRTVKRHWQSVGGGELD